jgi:VanZ family protein
LALAWYAVIFTLSQSPGADADSTYEALSWISLQDLNTLFRFMAHMSVFGVEGLLVYGALATLDRSVRTMVAAAAITALLGLGDEFHQSFVPLRHFRLFDVGLDTLGATLAVATAHSMAVLAGDGRARE